MTKVPSLFTQAVIFVIIFQLATINLLFAQKDSLKVLEDYPNLSSRQRGNFIHIGSDTSGKKYYLYKQLAYKFPQQDGKMLYVIYVQVFSPTYTTMHKVAYTNTNMISKWVVNFTTNNYYISQFHIYDSGMQYITGDLNDVHLWKAPKQGSIEHKLLQKACKLFYKE